MKIGRYDIDSLPPFHVLCGKTLTEIHGMVVGSGAVVFTCSDGHVFTLSHEPNCCESVDLLDITGDVADLIGAPILLADEVNNADHPPPREGFVDSNTWTFYRLATNKGYVTMRWFGESNGFYSETAVFRMVEAPDPKEEE